MAPDTKLLVHIERARIARTVIRRHTRTRIRQNSLVLVMQIEVPIGAAPCGASLAARSDLPVRVVRRCPLQVGVLGTIVRRWYCVVSAGVVEYTILPLEVISLTMPFCCSRWLFGRLLRRLTRLLRVGSGSYALPTRGRTMRIHSVR
jgi:hypothetical protein